MNTQLVILAAGKGTRMNSSLPKVLIGFKGKPLIQHLLDNTKEFHLVNKPIIVVGHRYELVQGYLGANYIYVFQQGQLGTGHAVLAAKTKSEAENTLVLCGDIPLIRPESLRRMMGHHEKKSAKFSILVAHVPNYENKYIFFKDLGRIIRGKNKEFLKIKEFADATDEEREITEVNSGIYLFNSKWLWEHLDQVQMNKHGEYYLTDLVEMAVKEDVSIETVPVEPVEIIGVNTPAQLKYAEEIVN